MADSTSFSMGWIPTVATAGGLALLLALGTWQFRSYQSKYQREQLREKRLEQPPASLDSLRDLEERRLNYRRVEARGELDAATRLVVKHRTYRGDPGSWLIQPLDLEEGGRLLVNRGWIPFQKARGNLDDYAAPPSDRPLEGLLYRVPDVVADDERRETLEQPSGLEGERTDWDTFDVTAMYDHLSGETPERPWVLVLGPLHTEGRYPIASYRHVTEPYLTSERHLGYAVFWYAVAAALVGLYLAAGFGVLRRRRRGHGHVPSSDS